MLYKRRVKRIIDGDTFVMSSSIQNLSKIRLADVNAKPISTIAGRRAKDLLKQILGRRSVLIKPVSISYDRLVAEVYIGTKSVNQIMINHGYK